MHVSDKVYMYVFQALKYILFANIYVWNYTSKMKFGIGVFGADI